MLNAPSINSYVSIKACGKVTNSGDDLESIQKIVNHISNRLEGFRSVQVGDDVVVIFKKDETEVDICDSDSYSQVVSLNRGELAEMFMTAGSDPFTVTFVKHNGETRKLKGVLIVSEVHQGMTVVRDLELPHESGLRTVDRRNVIELVLRNVKYVLK